MRTIGLIGGISWHSTAVYYSTINSLIAEKLGGNYAAELMLYSVNYHEFKKLQTVNDWEGIERMLTGIATRLEHAGCDCILLCSNTPHLIADGLVKALKVPFIHIADATANEIRKTNMKKIGLLGTRFTMENTFFRDRMTAVGVDCMIPFLQDREFIHDSILKELSHGVFTEDTKREYLSLISRLKDEGAEGVILGCTEIPMLLKQEDCNLQLFDTVAIHAQAAVDFALT